MELEQRYQRWWILHWLQRLILVAESFQIGAFKSNVLAEWLKHLSDVGVTLS